MPVSLQEPPSGLLAICEEPEIESRLLHVEWNTTRFECAIANIAQRVAAPDSSPTVAAPVRLRVNEPGPGDPGRIEFFCEAGRLCGATVS